MVSSLIVPLESVAAAVNIVGVRVKNTTTEPVAMGSKPVYVSGSCSISLADFICRVRCFSFCKLHL